jgi:hypothetical protein
MPISQNRLINLVAHADAMLDAFDRIKRYNKQLNIGQILSNGNSVIEHTSDDVARNTTIELVQTLGALYSAINDMEIPMSLRSNIIEERTHFKQHRKSNEYLANYKRTKTSVERQIAESMYQIPQFFTPQEQEEQTTIDRAKPFAKDEIKVKDGYENWRKDATEQSLRVSKYKTLEDIRSELLASGKVIDNTLANERSNSPFPPGEAEPLKPGQLQEMRQSSDPDILSRSTPTDEELYAPLKSGKVL